MTSCGSQTISATSPVHHHVTTVDGDGVVPHGVGRQAPCEILRDFVKRWRVDGDAIIISETMILPFLGQPESVYTFDDVPRLLGWRQRLA